MELSPFLQTLLVVMGLTALALTTISLLLLWWLYGRLERLRIKEDEELGETLRRVPLLLMVALDLLDTALDFFSAPFVWAFLNHMGWNKLRNLATAVAVVPGTQLLPILTISWLLVRVLGKRSYGLLEAAEKEGEKSGRSSRPADA